MENGRTIELLSIGLVRDDGREYYAEFNEADYSNANQWVKENVIPYLNGWTNPLSESIKPRALIAKEIQHFVGMRPEFWGWYADYDWVALCQVYGTMMALPQTWPMYCRDLKQWADQLGNLEIPGSLRVDAELNEHHALHDARWNRMVYELLNARAKAAH